MSIFFDIINSLKVFEIIIFFFENFFLILSYITLLVITKILGLYFFICFSIK